MDRDRQYIGEGTQGSVRKAGKEAKGHWRNGIVKFWIAVGHR